MITNLDGVLGTRAVACYLNLLLLGVSWLGECRHFYLFSSVFAERERGNH